ncbi:MAG TPA: alpha/beta fold hydrolase [Patescibacteria group bacterium]|nr:alpha/beta fold hydrolase [Patescibacteria group bacterium]
MLLKKLILIMIAGGIVVFLLYLYIEKNHYYNITPEFSVSESKNNNTAPEPVPFEELTIPYLRSRKYTSTLGIMEIISENGSYVSYLTSYLSDGFKVYGQLTQPTGKKPEDGWPAIIFIHGYIPPAQYQTLVNYSSYVDYLARNGFVVFKIDLRGHGKSEGEPRGGYYSSDYVIDVLNAYAALQSSKFADKQKIGLWGHSMAGNVAFRSAVADKEIPAVVIWSGAVYTYEDLQEYGINDNSYRPPSEDSPGRRKRNELFETYGQFNSESDFWKQVVPVNYLAGVETAFQLNHAVNDNVVTVEYSRNLAKILNEISLVYELKEYFGGGHNMTGNSFNQAMRNTVEFFKKYL